MKWAQNGLVFMVDTATAGQKITMTVKRLMPDEIDGESLCFDGILVADDMLEPLRQLTMYALAKKMAAKHRGTQMQEAWEIEANDRQQMYAYTLGIAQKHIRAKSISPNAQLRNRWP